MGELEKIDPEIYEAIRLETERLEYKLELIASENMVSEAVLEATGSVLTNKYAEGYPGKRYYGGCDYVDIAERLAIERAKELFGVEHVNVQLHSGSQANMAVYMTLLKPGDKILGMDLSHGGHLTHGSPVSFSGQLYDSVFYGVSKDNQRIDMNQVREMAKEHRPELIIVGASAYPRIIDFKAFRKIADETGAKVVVDMAHIAGLVATGLHPSPVPYSDFITTTTHKTLRGPRGGMVMTTAEYAKALDKTVFPGIQGGPLMHVIAAKAVALKEALDPSFKTYQTQVLSNAHTMASELVKRGYDLVSGGTDNHLILVDLTNMAITGKEAEEALELAGITVNKNTVPFETRSPFITSGIRIGVPAATTRGMKDEEMRLVASFMDMAIKDRNNHTVLSKIKEEIKDLCRNYPFYKQRLG